MSLIPPPGVKALTPEQIFDQAANLQTSFGAYAGASYQEGFEQSVLGERLHEAPPLAGQAPDDFEHRFPFRTHPGDDPAAKIAEPITEDQFKASIHWRPGIPYQPGMTEGRLEALASDYDNAVWRQSVYSRYGGGFLGKAGGIAAEFAGQASSPESFINVLGEGAKAAMIGRLGKVGGGFAIGAVEGFAGTALTEPFIWRYQHDRGQDYGAAEIAADLLFGSVIGGGFGAAHGAYSRLRHGPYVAPELQPVAEPPTIPTVTPVPEPTEPGVMPPLHGEAPGGPPAPPPPGAPPGGPGEAAAAGEAPPVEAGVRVISGFHGTATVFAPEEGAPHGRFRDEKIGSGAGKLTFGHGHYIASSEDLARTYQPLPYVEYAGPPELLSDDQKIDIAAFSEGATTADEAVERLRKNGKGDLADFVQAHPDYVQPGQNRALYNVNITRDPAEFLDWDKPLSEQTPQVQERLQALLEANPKVKERIAASRQAEALYNPKAKIDREITGGEIYRALGNSKAVTAAMRDAGIAGIRYAAPGVGVEGRGRGTANFVVFNPHDLQITGREPPAPPLNRAPRPGGDTLTPPVLEREIDAMNAAMDAVANGEPVDVGAMVPDRATKVQRVYTPTGRAIDTTFEVVDAKSLVTSQEHGTLNTNPAYPAELQPRERQRGASRRQIDQIAAGLNPELLGHSATAGEGAPIVGPDGVVESGNGRVLALRQAYDQHPEKAAAYRQWLERQGYDTTGMQEPVLIRRRQTPLEPAERQAFTREANARTTAAMSPAEQAKADAAALDPQLLDLVKSGDMHAAGNRPFARAFLEKVAAPSEMGGLVTAKGELSKAGADRIRNALLAYAYGDSDLVARLAEEPESELGTLGSALMEVAPQWAKLRSLIDRGQAAREGDGTGALMEAVQSIITSREAGNPIHFALKQGDMFAQGLSPDAKAWLRSLLAFDKRGNSRLIGKQKIADLLQRYAAEAEQHAPGKDMFNKDPPGPGAILVALGNLEPKVGEPIQVEDYGGKTIVEVVDRSKLEQPFRNMDQLYELAPEYQDRLADTGQAIAKELGVEFREPPDERYKKRSGSEEKMVRKKYRDIRQLTDVVRAGFVARNAAEGDMIVAAVAKRLRVIDEGWVRNDVGYVDRKLLVQFDNGLIAEVQIWPPEMIHAKEKMGGHDLYEAARSIKDQESPEVKALNAQQLELYDGALARSDPSFRSMFERPPAGPSARENLDLNSASERGLPESRTSEALTGSQTPVETSPGPVRMQNAEPASVMTAGRFSQSKNFIETPPSNPQMGALNRAVESVEPPHPSIVAAEPRVGRTEPKPLEALKKDMGLDPEELKAVEDQVEAMRQLGDLTEADERTLEAADEEVKTAEGWAAAYETLSSCVVRFG